MLTRRLFYLLLIATFFYIAAIRLMALLRQLASLLIALAVVIVATKYQFSAPSENTQVTFSNEGIKGHADDAPGRLTRRIVAVGDLHGDMPNALKVLQLGGVVDEKGNWTGDVDYFVQTGDIIDRYIHVQ